MNDANIDARAVGASVLMRAAMCIENGQLDGFILCVADRHGRSQSSSGVYHIGMDLNPLMAELINAAANFVAVNEGDKPANPPSTRNGPLGSKGNA